MAIPSERANSITRETLVAGVAMAQIYVDTLADLISRGRVSREEVMNLVGENSRGLSQCRPYRRKLRRMGLTNEEIIEGSIAGIERASRLLVMAYDAEGDAPNH